LDRYPKEAFSRINEGLSLSEGCPIISRAVAFRFSFSSTSQFSFVFSFVCESVCLFKIRFRLDTTPRLFGEENINNRINLINVFPVFSQLIKHPTLGDEISEDILHQYQSHSDIQ
jgi:hypothetical protein